MPAEVAEHIFDEMTAFASYAFNKAHAACYAVVAVQTAWLKYYYPAEFMAAMMNSVVGNASKIAAYIQYCRQKGIPVLPPHVNRSMRKFTVEKNKDGVKCVRMGMSGVKNVGNAAVDAIVAQRASDGAYRSIYDFCRRINTEAVNKRAVECLISAGCFDGLGATRLQCAHVYIAAMDANSGSRRANVAGQISLFDMDGPGSALLSMDTYPDVGEYPPRQLLEMEKEMTGVYVSGHPLDEYRPVLDGLETTTAWIEALKERPDSGLSEDRKSVVMGGILTEIKSKATKKGSMMGFVTLEDLTGRIECLIFPAVWERVGSILSPDLPVLLTGTLSVRDEEDTKLLVNTVEPLSTTMPVLTPAPPPLSPAERARLAPVRFFVRLKREQMAPVEAVLRRIPGEVPVYMNLPEEGITLLAPPEVWCSDPEEAKKALYGILDDKDMKAVAK